MADYLVYCLQSTKNAQRTYVGCTNNMSRRLRQHNGEIVGGARYTSAKSSRPWKIVFIVQNLTRTEAMRLEWKLKHKRASRLSGLSGRIETLKKHAITFNEPIKVYYF